MAQPKCGLIPYTVLHTMHPVCRARVMVPLPCTSCLLALCSCRYKQENVAPAAQGVTPVPETTQVQVDTLAGAPTGAPEAGQMGMADFLVLACDGLWDCMSNQQVGVSLLRLLPGGTLHCAGRCPGSLAQEWLKAKGVAQPLACVQDRFCGCLLTSNSSTSSIPGLGLCNCWTLSKSRATCCQSFTVGCQL